MAKGIPFVLTEKQMQKAREECEEFEIMWALTNEEKEILALRRESEMGCPVGFKTWK